MAISHHQIVLVCPICENQTAYLKYSREKKDVSALSGAFSPVAKDFGIFDDLYQCNRCNHLFVGTPRIDVNLQYKDAEDPGNYFNLWQYRMLNLRKLFCKVIPFIKVRNPKVLDVGAGGGIFLNLLKGLGIDSIGIEPSAQLARIGRNRFGVNLTEGTLKQVKLPHGSFDLVTLLEVIEHLENPRQEIELIKKYLKEKGMVLLVTPNIKSLSARVLGPRWWSFRQMHIQYFSLNSLDTMMNKAGFSLEWSGWFLKSFPISYYLSNLLSETISVPKFLNFTLRLSLGDMACLYRRNE